MPASRRWSTRSAGGQLEQPSEVNSSTTTGVAGGVAAVGSAAEASNQNTDLHHIFLKHNPRESDFIPLALRVAR